MPKKNKRLLHFLGMERRLSNKSAKIDLKIIYANTKMINNCTHVEKPVLSISLVVSVPKQGPYQTEQNIALELVNKEN